MTIWQFSAKKGDYLLIAATIQIGSAWFPIGKKPMQELPDLNDIVFITVKSLIYAKGIIIKKTDRDFFVKYSTDFQPGVIELRNKKQNWTKLDVIPI